MAVSTQSISEFSHCHVPVDRPFVSLDRQAGLPGQLGHDRRSRGFLLSRTRPSPSPERDLEHAAGEDRGRVAAGALPAGLLWAQADGNVALGRQCSALVFRTHHRLCHIPQLDLVVHAAVRRHLARWSTDRLHFSAAAVGRRLVPIGNIRSLRRRLYRHRAVRSLFPVLLRRSSNQERQRNRIGPGDRRPHRHERDVRSSRRRQRCGADIGRRRKKAIAVYRRHSRAGHFRGSRRHHRRRDEAG